MKNLLCNILSVSLTFLAENLKLCGIYLKKKQSYKEEYIREAFVRLQHKVPRHGNVILKIGDRYFRCRELG